MFMSMQSLSFLLILLLAAPARGVDLLFFSNDDVCDTSRDAYVACTGITQNTCCASYKPYCETFILEQIGGDFNHYAMGEGSCLRNGSYTWAKDESGLRYCIGLPQDVTSEMCSSYWEPLQGKEALEAAGDIINCREPDKMGYHDGERMREIHLPDGTFWDAIKHHQDKNYKALLAYPAWNRSTVKRRN
ncbi:hypothetical protein J7T55_015728 [Diaporthe amygdali]|uniref:uncharacterized protein n=1 Tax=Phomopsis amygdali TaxID=1214568 RepID=UPI0022FE02BA|nr:uncharacterized protein J7T55_015728 [Diaporthe amygdali]KAJ0120988.1 hypothetical protein J7T55_015728 [Diaporthe amygdali]